MKQIFQLLIAASLLPTTLLGQSEGPYTIRHSAEFESPKGHRLYKAIPYGANGIVQINEDGLESVNFQLFSKDLEFQKQNTVDIKSKFTNPKVSLDWIYKMKEKTYVFVREVYKETKTEGISAIEFSPEKLDVVGEPIKLYTSSDKVTWGIHSSRISEDRSKIAYNYTLVAAERNDKLNTHIVGIYVYDENLNKLWGDEFKMPYTEAKMNFESSTLGDDGKYYQMIKVYEDDRKKEATKDKKPNYHYEVLVFEKGQAQPKIVEIKLENYFPEDTYIYEDVNHNIVVAGFYSKGVNSPTDGAYMVKLDVANGTIAKLHGGYYEIPSDVIKSYMTDRQKEKIEKKEKKNKDDETKELGINNLRIRDIYAMQNGSSTIIAEQYWVEVYTHYNGKTTTTTYKTFANDIFVMNIDANGKLAWVKKIPKRQRSNDASGSGLSINSYAIGNDVHLFYIDHIENFDLPENEAPRTHMNNAGGFLVGLNINETGMIRKYNLADVKLFETNFYIRDFIDGRNNNLIDVERKRKKNILFSIDIK